MHISDNGLDLIKQFEGFRSAPYLDPVGIPTIGYGATYYPGGRRVRMTDTPISEPFASDMLRHQVTTYGDGIDRYAQVRALLWGHIHQEFDQLRNGAGLVARRWVRLKKLKG